MDDTNAGTRAGRIAATLLAPCLTVLLSCADLPDHDGPGAADSSDPVALLLKEGRLARQTIADPLPPPVFADLPHPVAAAFDAAPTGAALYGVLTEAGVELWIQEREDQAPLFLAPAAVSGRFLPGGEVAWLSDRGSLHVFGMPAALAHDVAAFGAGPDGSLILARDDEAGSRMGLWLLDSDGSERLLSSAGLTGIWSSRYAPALDPSGTRVAFLEGDADGVSVLELDLETGTERALSRDALPPIEAISWVGSGQLVLSGLGYDQFADTELLLLEVTDQPMPVRAMGDALVVGALGDRALVTSELESESLTTIRRALVDLSSAAFIDPWELQAVEALAPLRQLQGGDESSEFGVMRQALGFYGVKYSRPLQGGTLTSFFSHGSKRFDCACNGRSCRQGHRGTDIGAPRGTSIFAAAAGSVGTVVTGCGEGNHSCGGGYGNYVRLVHANGAATYYAHMTTVSKRSGSARCHEGLGTVGNTGHSYGAHIHFEIRSSGGARLDPFHGRCNNTVNQSLWVNQGSNNPVFTCGTAAPAPTPAPAPAPSPTVGTGTATLQGIIHVAGDTSRRISGATVSVAGKRLTTDANGYYSVRVSAGTHTATASASGYQSGSVTRSVPAGSQVWGSIGLSRQQTTAPSGTGRLVGVVYEAPNSSRRLSGVSVRLSTGAAATTGADGYFAFNVTAGTHTVTFSRSGFQTASVSRRVGAGDTVWGSVGMRRQEARGTLRGVVYQNPSTNQRISGATVTLSNGQRATSDANGAFSFQVAAGSYRVTASKAGYNTGTVVRTVQTGSETWGSVGLSRVASATGELIGVVYVRPNTSERVPGARVWTSTGQSAITSSTGVYTLKGVPAGQVSIYAGATGYSSGSVDRTVRAGEQVWGSVGLARASSGGGGSGGSGEDEDDTGFAFQGIMRVLSPINGELTGADPEFAWENLPVSAANASSFRYRVVLISEDGSETKEAEVAGAVGGETRSTIGQSLEPGKWLWVVYAISHEGTMLASSALQDDVRGVEAIFEVR